MKDLIERQAVIEINRSYHGQMPNEVNYRIWKEINELPSAQPKQVCFATVTLTDEQVKEAVEKTKNAVISVIEPEPCEDAVSRQAATAECFQSMVVLSSEFGNELPDGEKRFNDGLRKAIEKIRELPPVTPKTEQRWIPVTLETLPNPGSVVVVCGKKGTWDYGTYRGWYGDIHSWQWKKNTIKKVYWWMRKADVLPEPFREEGDK